MTPDAWQMLVRSISEDIDGMSRAKRVLQDVDEIWDQRAANPTEEQLIDAALNGNEIGVPQRIVVAGRVIEIRKLHRAGIRCADVKGADLIYEIAGVKFVLVQYKTPTPAGRVKLDRPQLDELRDACPVRCGPSDRHGCGSWYAIASRADKRYLPACEALNVFGLVESRDASAFINGVPDGLFQKDFAKCRLGARIAPEKRYVSIGRYQNQLIGADHVVFRVSRGP